MSYTVRWQRAWSIVVAAGVGLSFLVWHPGPALIGLTISVLCAAALVGLASSTRPTPLGGGRPATLGLLLGSALAAFCAVTVLSPSVALALLLVAVATSPWVTRWTSARLGVPLPDTTRQAHDAAADPAPLEGPDPTQAARWDLSAPSVRTLSNSELCRAWRQSFVGLQSARSDEELLQVIAVRQLCLDELERRSPSALDAWLSSGARAAGGPERFLLDDSSDGRSDAA